LLSAVMGMLERSPGANANQESAVRLARIRTRGSASDDTKQHERPQASVRGGSPALGRPKGYAGRHPLKAHAVAPITG